MWPSNRSQEDAAEEEEEVQAISPLVVDEDVKPPNKRQGSMGSNRRASESAEAYQRRTRTELNLMQRTDRAMEVKKQREEQERLEREAKEKARREKARQLRERAKKADSGRRKGKKKKAKKVLVAAQCSIGDVVLSQKGIAVVRWKGILHFRPNDTEWLGIEFLDDPHGKNDGSVKGQRYFQTKPKHGSFVKSVTKKLRPEEILRKLGLVKSQLRQKEQEMGEIKDQMDELMQVQQEQLESLPKVDLNNNSTNNNDMYLKTTKTLHLAKSISGSIDNIASRENVVQDFVLKLQEVYDDSSSDYEYIESDSEEEEEEIMPVERRKSERKQLVDVTQSRLYSEGSLRRIQDELLDQIDMLKEQESGVQNAQSRLRRQRTFAGTKELGLDLPELHSTAEEVEEWIKENLHKAPGCPDLENKQVLSALVWAMRAFLNLNEGHTY